MYVNLVAKSGAIMYSRSMHFVLLTYGAIVLIMFFYYVECFEAKKFT